MSILIDGYSKTNQDTTLKITNVAGEIGGVGQTFTGDGKKIKKLTAYLQKVGSPTGELWATIYDHVGTWGTNGVPLAGWIARSKNVDISIIGSSLIEVDFEFPKMYQELLVSGTHYCLKIFADSIWDSDNCIAVGIDASSPTHPGNLFTEVWGSNTADATKDMIFGVYTDETSDDVADIQEPDKFITSKEINGAWTAKMRLQKNSYIDAESYIEYNSEIWIVKNIRKTISRGNIYFDVSLDHNMSELSNTTTGRLYMTDTVTNCLSTILGNSAWGSGTVDITKTVVINIERRMATLEALYMLAELADGELYYNSTARTVDLKDQIGSSNKIQLRADKNLEYIQKDIDSTNLITRLYPYGPDNLPINSSLVDDCDDETLYTASGAGTIAANTANKVQGTQAIEFYSTTDTETFIRDFGIGNELDLSAVDEIRFFVHAKEDMPSGRWTIGIGEAAYNEQTLNFPITSKQNEGNTREITWDISAVTPADRNAIRYIGFKHNTADDDYLVIDDIREFTGNDYIDSPNINDYKIRKEDTYFHTGNVEQEQATIKIYPSDDTFGDSYYPDTARGGLTYTAFENSTIYRPMFFKWDFADIPPSATITGATFYLKKKSGATNADTVLTELCDADWEEETLTYTNMPGVAGGSIHTWDFDAADGWFDCGGDMLATMQNWFTTTANNYGIRLWMAGAFNYSLFYSKEDPDVDNRPYLEVTYTLGATPKEIIKDAATKFLYSVDEPKVYYRTRGVDLSKAIVDTWEDDAIALGDTIRLYVKELDMNVDVRIMKIKEDLLKHTSVLELSNKTLDMSDTQLVMLRKLKYAMPFENNKRIISANVITEGYLGDV